MMMSIRVAYILLLLSSNISLKLPFNIYLIFFLWKISIECEKISQACWDDNVRRYVYLDTVPLSVV
jgi:hypothetical protein